MTVEHILLIVASYWIGAIPFGVIVSRRYNVDILKVGSCNPGATNVWRILGPKPGSLVFLLDVLKGYVPAAVGLFVFYNTELALGAGMTAMIGHSFSVFLRFKGGKGIATGLGMLLGSLPEVALSAFGLFLVIVALTRYISLGSVIAAASLAIFGWIFQESWPIIAALGLMGAFVVYRHRANIARLLQGTESKFQMSKSTPPKAVVEGGQLTDSPPHVSNEPTDSETAEPTKP